MKKAARLIVKGTVQGVFFRRFVQEHALNIGLRGLVRSLESGDMEIIVEGEAEQIERMIGIVKKGTEHSQIRDVKVEERKWSGDFDGFKIIRF